jgi:integrase
MIQAETIATPSIRPRTLEDVVTSLEAADRTAPTRRKVLIAAVQAAARLLNRPLEVVAADPKVLLPSLAQLTPVSTGRSGKTIDNTRSLVKEALVLVGAGRRVRFDGTPLSPAWQALYDSLPTKRLTNALSRFMHYANQAGRAPDQVDQALLEQFVADLHASGEVANVGGRHRATAVLWNRCVNTITGWPSTVLTEPITARPRKNLGWNAFLPEFREAVETYCSWLSGADVFSEHAPPKPCKPTTIRQRRETIRIAASNLVASGFPVVELRDLDILVRPENAKRILKRLHEQNGNKVSAFIQSVATGLIYIAARYRNADAAAVDALKDLRRKLGSLPGGLTKKNRRLLQQLEDERLLNKLLDVPALLASDARRSALSRQRRVQMMEVAVAIELLLCAPIRLANLSTLELGRHLPHSFKQGDIHLSLACEEVKNGRPMLLPLSTSARQLLDEYITKFRPLIAESHDSFLFPGHDGKPKTPDSLRDGITKAIQRRAGIHMTPHQFRHLAGDLILRADPGAYALVQQLLGHINFKTTLNFYAANQSRAAGRVLDEVVTARRQRRGA